MSGSRYLGGFIGSDDGIKDFLVNKIEKWNSHISKLAEVCDVCPHEAYSAFTRSVQAEWAFIQRVIPDCSLYMQDLEQAICSKFKSLIDSPNDVQHKIYSLPCRKRGLGIPTSETSSYESSIKSCRKISKSLMDSSVPFDVGVHKFCVSEEKVRRRKSQDMSDILFNKNCVNGSPVVKKRLIRNFNNKHSNWLTSKRSLRDGF